MKKFLKPLLIIVSVIAALMILIGTIPGAEKVVGEQVQSFASSWYPVAVSVVILLLAAAVFPFSAVLGVALIVIGASIIWYTVSSRSKRGA